MEQPYARPELTDITKVHFTQVLKSLYPEMGKLQNALDGVHIDRILQAYIDYQVELNRRTSSSDHLLGMTMMGMLIKNFISNIGRLNSLEAKETMESIEDEEFLLANGISKRDIERLNNFK
jgi:hypothetical protein